MTELIYIGPDPADVGVVPLPEGWSAANHEEPDIDLAAEKVASRMYRAKAEKPAGTTTSAAAEKED
ncbi:MAG: hypothetical protein ACR2NO_05655 [Chloroflexota bacterium]